VLGWLLATLWSSPAHAHLMVAQKGTINLAGQGAYLVASIPVSAFGGVDDNGDGLLSLEEMRQHGADIERQVLSGIRLSDRHGARPLEGLMLNLAQSDEAPTAPVSHLIVLGRYALTDPGLPLQLSLSLFGTADSERRLEFTITQGAQKQRIVLAPGHAEHALLSPPWAVFADYLKLGLEHVLGGMDHLLFLLVVLATGFGLRNTLITLSCFTAGHASTLVASVMWGFTAPAAIVEPAIAATIVGMALFDRWSSARAKPLPGLLRLALVYACALIHGLGLAEALRDLDPDHRLIGLTGFNLGVEAAQVAVAALVAALALAVRAVRRMGNHHGLLPWRSLASSLGVALGSVWLVQRALAALPG
jgi:hypothetical protein